MIQDLKHRISHFRSELLMGRYLQAVEEGMAVRHALTQIMEFGIETDQLAIILRDVNEEIQLAENFAILLQIKEEKKEPRPKEKPEKKPVSKGKPVSKPKPKSNPKSAGKPEKGTSRDKKRPAKEEEIITLEQTDVVSKWGNKRDSPSKKPRTDTFKEEKREPAPAKGPAEEEDADEGMLLAKDEEKILEQDTILPLNLPQFFKAKEPHRLIVVYFEKCTDLLKRIAEALAGKFVAIELEELEQWAGAQQKPQEKEKIKIYIAPFEEGRERLIRGMLEAENSLIVLYAGNDRQMLSEKLSSLKKPGYRLAF